MAKRIGFIGLGHMGAPMAGRLLEAGYPLTVYNRSAERTRELVARGASGAGSPADLAHTADLVISMLSDGRVLLEVALGETGVLAGARPGLLLVDMSTVAPNESAQLAASCEGVGVDYLRAPVSGSTMLAASGLLTILASGPRERFEEVGDVLAVLGQQRYYLGPGEEARVMKLALNMMVGTTMAAFAESQVLGEKAGLNWQSMLEVFANSAVGSPLVKYKTPPLERRDFSPAFTVELMAKDFDLALEAARHLGVAAPVTALVRQVLQATASSGWSSHDFSAVLLFLERAAGLDPGG